MPIRCQTDSPRCTGREEGGRASNVACNEKNTGNLIDRAYEYRILIARAANYRVALFSIDSGGKRTGAAIALSPALLPECFPAAIAGRDA